MDALVLQRGKPFMTAWQRREKVESLVNVRGDGQGGVAVEGQECGRAFSRRAG